MKKASELIDQLFSHLDLEKEKGYISLFQEWEQIVGTDAAEHSKIKEIEGTVIIVSVDHPGWSQMITMKKGHILRALAQKYPELGISSIRIVLG